MQQKLFNFFLPQEAGAFGNNLEKEPQKPRPKLKNVYVIYLQRTCSACNAMHVVAFCKNLQIL